MSVFIEGHVGDRWELRDVSTIIGLHDGKVPGLPKLPDAQSNLLNRPGQAWASILGSVQISRRSVCYELRSISPTAVLQSPHVTTFTDVRPRRVET